jgi:hypothetical protein
LMFVICCCCCKASPVCSLLLTHAQGWVW